MSEFARRALTPGPFSRAVWAQAGEGGLLGYPIPVEYGGGGQSYRESLSAMTELGEASGNNGMTFAITTHLWACTVPLWRFGSQAQRNAYLPRLVSGEWVGALAATEPESGSDLTGIQTTATEHRQGYVLNGHKTYVTNAPEADLILVLARHESGHAIFAVERGTPGLTTGPEMERLGLSGCTIGPVSLRQCLVPPECLLGRLGQGMLILNVCFELERAYTFAAALGTTRRLLQLSLARAREREQFGKPIAAHQSISDRLVATKVSIDLAELLLQRIATLHDQGKSAYYEAAVAKLTIGEALKRAALDCLDIHAGAGYFSPTVSSEVRDALAATIYSGTSEIQKQIIARYLGL